MFFEKTPTFFAEHLEEIATFVVSISIAPFMFTLTQCLLMMYRRFFRWCLYSVLVALWTMPLSSRAVAFRYVKNFMVMESTLFYQDKVLPHEVGVSTTLTHCLMDSTYAVNVLKVDVAHLKSAVMNKKEGGYYSLQLDSLNFCGETYRNVMFVVTEMQQKFKGKVPDLVLGNSILSHRAWHVDLQRHTFTPCSPDRYYGKIRLKCSIGKGVEYGFVFLKAKVGGRKVRMQFSLNKGLHLLPHGVYGFPWQSLTREGGSFDRPLSSETVPLYKDVATQIGDFHFVADYRLGYPGEDKVGTLYIDALEGKSFVLNYPKKVIEILE